MTDIKRQKLFWIKERNNPQLGIYYVREGQLSKASAKAKEGSIYGYNTMHSYPDEKAYLEAIEELKEKGANFL
jgi:hypothetical protein